MNSLALNRTEQAVGLGVLFVSIAASIYFTNYLFAAIPFLFLLALTMGLNWRLVYWFMLFSIPASMHVSFLDDAISTSLPDEPIMWLFCLVFAAMFARDPGMIPKWYWRNPLVLIVVLQYIWLIITVIYSKETLLSVKFMAAKSWFLVSFFVLPIFIFKEKKDFKKGFLLMLIPMFITILIIMAKHATLGFHFRKVEKAILGIYINHVDYSTVLSMFFPLTFVAYFLTRGRSWVTRGIMLFVMLFFLPAVYLTFARAAMLAIVFALMIGVAIRMKLVNLVMPAIFGLIVFLMIVVTDNNKFLDYRPNYQKTFMRNNFEDHIIATLRGQDMSSMERVYRWIASVRMSRDEPVTGYGPNAFYYYYKPYAVSSFRTYTSRNNEHSTTHNYFLFMLTEQGWPGMILYCIMLVVFFAHAQKIYHRFNDKFYRACTIGLAMLFAACFINNFFSELLENHKVGSLFFLSMSLMVVLDKKSRDLQGKTEEEAATTPV